MRRRKRRARRAAQPRFVTHKSESGVRVRKETTVVEENEKKTAYSVERSPVLLSFCVEVH